jgi:uncharacterized membrane protein
MQSPLGRLRTKVIAGLLVTVPAVVTILALQFLFRQVDGLLGPWVAKILGREVPGLGLIATLLLVLLMGFIATNFLGRRFISLGESIFGNVPLVRRIYRVSKEVVEAVVSPRRQLFREVVMVEYPSKGLYAYGFVTGATRRRDQAEHEELVNVFLPGVPVPTTGNLLAVPPDQVRRLDLSVEDALKLIVSGGLIVPEEIAGSPSARTENPRPPS